MTNDQAIYIKSAIDAIYGEDDDFVVLGLTGRTGSGCSTVAKILASDKDLVRHSLCCGNNPSTNDERKQRIIYRHFSKTWCPFHLIQVSSVITLMMIKDEDWKNAIDESVEHLSTETKKSLKDKLIELEDNYKTFKGSIESEKDSLIKFYTKKLPEQYKEIRELLGESDCVKLYQAIGTNIRLSGKPFCKEHSEKSFFTLAEEINLIIKEIREINKSLGQKTLIAIDAIRNPFEAIYFQDRYSAFYLVAVSCPDDQRVSRLYKLGYSKKDVDIIDKQEYRSRKLCDTDTYYVQDIQSCLQRSDIYISNPDDINKVSEYTNLSNQIIRFVSLMKRPGIITPTAVERTMQLAYTAKLNSGCISRQVGAAITDENYSIQAIGWNDTPHGQVPCNLRNREDLLSGFDQFAYSEYERGDEEYLSFFRKECEKYTHIGKDDSGRNLSYCFKSEYNTLTKKDNQVHTRSLHAEENAFLQISKYGGRGIKGGILFTTASPCELCAKKAYQLGITKIYYIDPYPGIAMSHIIKGGTNNPELILFHGAIGRAFHLLYTPIIPYKDELNIFKQNL
jgi:deoxycytidylate deaminase/dephospho-CoA kinase